MARKIKRKPSPAQARVIKVMHDYGPLWINDRGILLNEGGGWSRLDKEAAQKWGKPRQATINACVREEWLEDVEPEKTAQYAEKYGSAKPYRFKLSELGHEWGEKLTDEDLVAKHKGMKAAQVVSILKQRHPFPEWLFIPELRLGTGYSYGQRGDYRGIPVEQRIDAFAMHCWPSKKFERIAYEIKVHRGDWIKEMAQPKKREASLLFSNRMYFAAPEGLIKPREIPEPCGLIEVRGDGFWTVKVEALFRESAEPSWSFIASMGRSVIKMEGTHGSF